MIRAWMMALLLCFASQSFADTIRPGQRAELQIGGPLRIIKRDTLTEPASSEKSIPKTRAIEPSYGLSPSVNGALEGDGQLVSGLAQEEDQDPSLAYALTRSVSVGIGYNFIEAEDLAADRAVDGIVDIDHQSHHLLFRALWHFK